MQSRLPALFHIDGGKHPARPPKERPIKTGWVSQLTVAAGLLLTKCPFASVGKILCSLCPSNPLSMCYHKHFHIIKMTFPYLCPLCRKLEIPLITAQMMYIFHMNMHDDKVC